MTAKAAPKGLKFYPASHRYKLDGEWVPGVTTIIGVLDKSTPLSKWAANEVAGFVADQPSLVDLMDEKGGRDPLYQFLRAIPWSKRDTAATRGTTFHDFAEKIMLGETVEVPPEQVGMVESALSFFEDWHIEPVLVEATVASREHKWAGKLDLVASYVHPVTGESGVAIFDYKSGKAIYTSAAFQLNAYAHAEFSGEGGDEHPLPAIDAAFGVHIREDGYDCYPLQFGPDIYAEFLNVRESFAINKRANGNWKTPGSGYVGVPVVHNTVEEVA